MDGHDRGSRRAGSASRFHGSRTRARHYDQSASGDDEILEAVVERIPPPRDFPDHKLRALVFDSTFDIYRGVITYVRVFSGEMEAGTAVKLMSNDARYEVKEVGIFTPKPLAQSRLSA